jgi:hypothetical protein
VVDKTNKKSTSSTGVFDVSRPGSMPASAHSRPIIVSNKPKVEDPMMTPKTNVYVTHESDSDDNKTLKTREKVISPVGSTVDVSGSSTKASSEPKEEPTDSQSFDEIDFDKEFPDEINDEEFSEKAEQKNLSENHEKKIEPIKTTNESPAEESKIEVSVKKTQAEAEEPTDEQKDEKDEKKAEQVAEEKSEDESEKDGEEEVDVKVSSNSEQQKEEKQVATEESESSDGDSQEPNHIINESNSYQTSPQLSKDAQLVADEEKIKEDIESKRFYINTAHSGRQNAKQHHTTAILLFIAFLILVAITIYDIYY